MWKCFKVTPIPPPLPRHTQFPPGSVQLGVSNAAASKQEDCLVFNQFFWTTFCPSARKSSRRRNNSRRRVTQNKSNKPKPVQLPGMQLTSWTKTSINRATYKSIRKWHTQKFPYDPYLWHHWVTIIQFAPVIYDAQNNFLIREKSDVQ